MNGDAASYRASLPSEPTHAPVRSRAGRPPRRRLSRRLGGCGERGAGRLDVGGDDRGHLARFLLPPDDALQRGS